MAMQDGYQPWSDVEEQPVVNEEVGSFDVGSLQEMSNIIKLSLSSPGHRAPLGDRLANLDLEGVIEMTRRSAEQLRETKALLQERELRTREFMRRTTEELRVAEERILKAQSRIAEAEAKEGMAEARVAAAESWITHIQDTLTECFACEK
jgi:hypothetical protein